MSILSSILQNSRFETQGYCVSCDKLVPAKIVIHDKAVWLRRKCPVHGVSEVLQSQHPKHYLLMESMLAKAPQNVSFAHPLGSVDAVRGVFVDVTEKCNLHCPNCLTDAKTTLSGEPETIENVLDSLKQMLPYKPVVYLTGGEPTLLPNIVEWVASLSEAGYEVKLLSNGIKLVDENFCRELKKAGTTWMLLQFDGFDDDYLEALRGRPGLSEVRKKSLENLSKVGMSIDLACMIDAEYNLKDVGELIRFGFRTKGVKHVSFMPSRRIGRGDLTTDQNLLDEVRLIAEIDKQTGGKIKYRDWMSFFASMSAVYKLTGSADFVPRRCFMPLPLLGDSNNFYPATRVSGYLKDPRNVLAFLQMAAKAGRVESAKMSERSLLISIETFREWDSIDVCDAGRCSRFYLVDGHLKQACLYNNIERPRRRRKWEAQNTKHKHDIKKAG